MKKESVTLVARSVWFYSRSDEAAFFERLDKLTCISKYEGKGDALYIEVRPEAVDERELRELLAVFHRYGIDKKQLDAFDRQEFDQWFRSEKGYWFLEVFGAKKPQKSRSAAKR
jgi:hypothetical protein